MTKKIRITEVPPGVQSLLEERARLRAQKEWAQAHRLREELEARGYQVKDRPEGTEIYRLKPGPLTVSRLEEVPDRLSRPAEVGFRLVCGRTPHELTHARADH